jgi:acyl dehydratase
VRPYHVTARNTATESDNKIHDDAVARQYGFSGGLVPGVIVHAYLTHPPVERWGAEWLAAGTIKARFHRPVYDGDDVTVEPDHPAVEPDRSTLEALVVRTPSTDRAAVAEIGAPVEPADQTIDLTRWPHLPLPRAGERPPASEEAFAERPMLGALDAVVIDDGYLESIGETLPIYRAEGIGHPGWLIAQANYVLAANVLLGPWIHVESDVRHLGLVHDGDVVSTRAAVLGTSERKGHRFVELDVLIVDGSEQPVLRARHLAIYQPRKDVHRDH